MTRDTFETYFESFTTHWSRVPQWNDVKQILEWAADKPGMEFSWGDIAKVLDERATLLEVEIGKRVILALGILTAGARPIADVFYMIRSANGNLYPVANVETEVREGSKPFNLEATGETITDFDRSAYPYVRFRDFEPRPKPDAEASSNVST